MAATVTLEGKVIGGTGGANAPESSRSQLSEKFIASVGFAIIPGTINLVVNRPYFFRPDFVFPKSPTIPYEDVFITKCEIVRINRRTGEIVASMRDPAIITWTSIHFWGPSVLEVMASKRYQIGTGYTFSINIESSKVIYGCCASAEGR